MTRVATIEAVLSLDATQWERTLKRSTERLKTMATDSRAIAGAAGAFLTGAAVGLGKISQELYNAGGNVEQLRADLNAAFDGVDLDRITQRVRELGATPPYSAEQFANAAKAYKAFGGDVAQIEADLVRSGNLAVKTGGSFDTLSRAVASFGFRAEAANQLKEVANITPEKLVKFGAVLDKTGKALDFTGANGDKARAALRRLLDEDYAGAMDEVVLASDQLAGSFQLLKEDAGAALAEMGEGVAAYLVPLVEYLRAMPAPMKAAAGGAVFLAGAAASVGAAIIGIGLAMPAFSAGLAALPAASTLAAGAAVGLGGAIRGLTIATGRFIALLFSVPGALAAAAVALHLWTEAIEDSTKASEKLLEIELARAANQRGVNDLLGKNAEELRKEGKTARDVANGMLALQERIEAARAAGNDALVQRLTEQVIELKAAKEELAKGEKVQRDRDAATAAANTPEAKTARKKAAEEADKQREEQQRKDEEARQAALQSELNAIELRLAREEISVKESLRLRAEALEKFKASEDEKVRLQIETARTEKSLADQRAAEIKKKAEDEKKSAEDTRKAVLDARQQQIDQSKASGDLTKQGELAAINEILSQFKLSQDERVQYKRQAAQLETEIAKEEADKQTQIERELASAKEEERNLQRDAISDEIEQLQKETAKTGKDNSSRIKSAIEESLALQLESIRAEADRAKEAAASADVREQIERNAQLKIQDAIRDTAETEENATQEQIDAIKRLREEREKAQKEASGFGGDPFGLEDLNKSIQASLSVTAQTGSPAVKAANLPQVTSVQLDQAQPFRTASPVVADALGAREAKVSGEIGITVTFDAQGRPDISDVSTSGPSLDGRQSEIVRAGRGMKFTVGMG